MDNKKISEFILKLRKEHGFTQEQLANLIPISRQAVSKWERGETIPDATTLLKLSEIFDVSVNELLCGQKLTFQNKDEVNKITLDLFSKNKKNQKIIITLICFILFIVFIFLFYYFINLYQSIKVYTIDGSGKHFAINNGTFIVTNYKRYFNLGNLVMTDDYTIQHIRIYYVDKNKKEIEIYSTDQSDSLLLIDYNGYNEYFSNKNIKQIINNLFIQVMYNEDEDEIVKLNLTEDYVNKELFFKKDKPIAQEIKVNDLQSIDTNMIIKAIINKYEFNGDFYSYIINEHEISKEFLYNSITKEFILNIYDDSILIESWIYTINNNVLHYTCYKEKVIDYSFDINDGKANCLFGICKNEKEKNEIFWEYFLSTL